MFQKIAMIDYLAYNNHLTTNCYLETLVRYSNYYMLEETFLKFVIGKFFSQQAIYSQDKVVSCPSVYQLLRLVERTQCFKIFLTIVDLLLEKSTELIQSIEEGKISED